jgi:hypothetical protein
MKQILNVQMLFFAVSLLTQDLFLLLLVSPAKGEMAFTIRIDSPKMRISEL